MRIEAKIFFLNLFAIEVPLKCQGSAVEVPILVPWKCHWSAIEVLLNCRWSANRQQPTATATDLPLLTPPLSTVGWSKTAHFNKLGEKRDSPFFWKLCHHRQILGICSLTRGLHVTRKWVFCDITNIHTDGHRDSMTDPAQRAESVKRLLKKTGH